VASAHCFSSACNVIALLCLGPLSSLLLIADGAHSLRSFFTDTLAALADKTMILDWHHLKQKCYDLSSRICGGKTAKARYTDGRLAWIRAISREEADKW
jgi:hypothetical protein